jgi:hypothetical protein
LRPSAGFRRPFAGSRFRPLGRLRLGLRPFRPKRFAAIRPAQKRRLFASRRPARPIVGPRPPLTLTKPRRPGIGPGRLPATQLPARPLPPAAMRPPGMRPPGYRPPLWRPPSWRPPTYRPPYVRPPHYAWGGYYWHPIWNWYHTAVIAGATLAFVESLPSNGSDCEEIRVQSENLYDCGGTLYRATTHQSKKVYEIVSGDKPGSQSRTNHSSIGTDEFVELKLESPVLKGQRVRILQNALAGIGFNVGSIDGIFGTGTDRVVRNFQEWYGLPVTGVVDSATANAIAAEYTAVLAPRNPSTGVRSSPARAKRVRDALDKNVPTNDNRAIIDRVNKNSASPETEGVTATSVTDTVKPGKEVEASKSAQSPSPKSEETSPSSN